MRFGYTLLFVLAVALVACSKKHEAATQPQTDSQLIIGKWYYIADTVVNYINGVETSRDNAASQPTDYQQYNSDGTGVLSFGGVTTNYNYSISGKQLTFKAPQQPSRGATIRYISTTGLYLYSETADTDKSGNIYKTTEAAYLR